MYAAAVERNWFQHYLGGKPRQEITGNARGDDPSWDVATGQTIDGVIAEFESACAASRQIAAAFALDQTVPHDQLGPGVSALHLREHHRGARPPAGHADIIRKQIDGA